jgi:hypothetical protein
MSKKSQHNNILLAVIGFTAVVILVGVIGFFTLEQKDDTIQGEETDDAYENDYCCKTDYSEQYVVML